MIDLAKHKWKLFIIISAIGFFIDWYTKYLAVTNINIGQTIPVFGNILEWTLVFNKGALFGLNPRDWFPGFPVNLFFYVFSIIAMVLLLVYYKNIEGTTNWSYVGISLIMPGALGNLFDRIIRPGQGVVDFIKVDLNFSPFSPWPIFNMADIYITIGVIIIFIDMIIVETQNKKLEKAETSIESNTN